MVIGLPRKYILNIQELQHFFSLSIPLPVELYDEIQFEAWEVLDRARLQ